MNRIVFLTVGLCLVLPSTAQRRSVAKAPPLTGYKLISVKATGTRRYADKEILRASGLQIGQNATDGDFKEAARRLGDSGLFSGVAYSFSYSDTDVKVEFQLTDIDESKLVPVSFENFVWFSDARLLNAIQRVVPLFMQMLPITGRLPDKVTEALQALLTETHLPGRVDYLRQSRQEGGDLTRIVYKVEEVTMHIRTLEFPGATPEQSAFLTNAVDKLVGVEYSRDALAQVAKYDLLPLYFERGYLKARFGPSDARAVTPSAAEGESHPQDEIEVDASLPVTPGKQYSVFGVTWKGNSAVSVDEASHLFHLVTGRPVDAVRVADDVERLTKLYRSRGYMTAQVKPDAQLDDDKGTVHYDMNVTEGDLYQMGGLEILGVDSPSKDRLRAAWTLREGQAYNAGYTRKFLDEAPRFLPKGLQFSAQISEELDAKDKTVDVTIHFKMQ
jgi:outer membrane protein assembly factor BamA